MSEERMNEWNGHGICSNKIYILVYNHPLNRRVTSYFTSLGLAVLFYKMRKLGQI